MKFTTDYIYTNRETKAKYVWEKYNKLLKGKILDVGADQCYLQQYLPESTKYFSIGLGASVDQIVDLEKERIPFRDNTFNCVFCLDVLEHLDNIHDAFDELCRVTKKYVIISLPNPYNAFIHYLRNGNYQPSQHLKFYGLPLEKPEDRHKWFFSNEEANKFIKYKSKKNHMYIVQIDHDGNQPQHFNIISQIYNYFIARHFKFIFNKNLHNGTVWAVLKKINAK